MVHGRKRVSLALTAAAAFVAVAVVPTSPSYADPKIDDVKTKVAKLYEDAENAQERYNDAQLKLTTVNGELAGLKKDQARQQARVTAARSTVESSIVDQYTGQGISAVGQVVVSDDPTAFLEGMTTMSEYNDMQTDAFGDYATELKALNIRKAETQQRQRQATALQTQLKTEKTTVDARYAKAKTLLDSLEAKQREALLAASRSGDTTNIPDVPVSGRAAAAVKYALAQVGDAYVYGAAGPNAFDCSGLTMMAWAQAGVGLPHSSSAQQGSGPRISESDLKPGDLVFYYSPVHHVGMYIGGGLIVHAANPGTGVVVSGLHSMPYSGAVRPG